MLSRQCLIDEFDCMVKENVSGDKDAHPIFACAGALFNVGEQIDMVTGVFFMGVADGELAELVC